VVVQQEGLERTGAGYLGQIWLARLEGDINSRLHKLEATLERGNFLLQRFADFELEATLTAHTHTHSCVLTHTRSYCFGSR
jgi:hypothetical protein